MGGLNREKCRVAYFVSPHGFGHAARASGVMAAIHEIDPLIQFEIFTKVPLWFFEESVCAPFEYNSLLTDIGLVQETPMHADLAKTVKQLNEFMPFKTSDIGRLAEKVKTSECQLVVSDISPLGIAVAKEVGVPSILVENFTWDWVYQEYVGSDNRFKKHISYLKGLFETADYHVQTEPVCCHSSKADLTTLPVSRRVRSISKDIRKRLGAVSGSRLVMITMGGVSERNHSLRELPDYEDICFVIPGGGNSKEILRNVIILPHHSEFFHPDLINASDAIVGKVGYSTLAEVYHSGVPFGYIKRAHFQESEILASYIREHMKGVVIKEKKFQEGSWVTQLSELLALSRIKRKGPNGAEQVARFLLRLLVS